MSKLALEEAFNLLCGRLIGEGAFRKVFECKIDPSLVVKVEDETDSFANIGEFQTWQDFQGYAPVGKWLAPCVSLSPYGRVLMQKRVEPLRKADLPEKVPAFLTDMKMDNFGMFEGRLVCCDYATIIVNPGTRMKKAEWW